METCRVNVCYRPMRIAWVELPVTRYALSGNVNIAYQIMGQGPIDIVIVPGVVSHVEFLHEVPGYTAFLRRLSDFARVVSFDKRGQGLSDRISDAPSLEQRMDDVRAVMPGRGAVLTGTPAHARSSVSPESFRLSLMQ